jgi:hypothetical protein
MKGRLQGSLGVLDARHEDGGELVGFVEQVGESLGGEDLGVNQSIEPVCRFLKFLTATLDLANELRGRSGRHASR